MCHNVVAKVATVFLKWTMVIVNIGFVVVGGILLAIGVWLHIDPYAIHVTLLGSPTPNTVAPVWEASIVSTIIVGAVSLCIGLLGFVGLVCESISILILYEAITLLCILGEMLAGSLAIMYDIGIAHGLDRYMMMQVQEYYGDPMYTEMTTAWDSVQSQQACCATFTYKEYFANNNTHLNVPWSCCVMGMTAMISPGNLKNESKCKKDAIDGALASDFLHITGCYDYVFHTIDTFSKVILGLSFILFIVQVFGILISGCIRVRKRELLEDENDNT